MAEKPKDIDNRDEEITEEITEITVIDFQAPSDRRKHPRFDAELTAVVYSTNGSFRTKTLNISEGGLRILDRLPDDFQDVGLEVLMIEEKSDAPYEYYLFKAKTLGPHQDGFRLQFTWVPAQTLAPYREYLNRLEHQNAARAA